MKNKKIKLRLNKETIANLSEQQMNRIQGGVQYAGTTYSDNLCQNTNASCVSKHVKCPVTKVVEGNTWDDVGVIYDNEADIWFDAVNGRNYTEDELGFWPEN